MGSESGLLEIEGAQKVRCTLMCTIVESKLPGGMLRIEHDI